MNRKQKVALWLGLTLFAAIGVYPPVQTKIAHVGVGSGLYAEYFTGYAWLFQSVEPKYPKETGQPLTTKQHIETDRLLIQWAMACFLSGGLVWTLADRRDTGASK